MFRGVNCAPETGGCTVIMLADTDGAVRCRFYWPHPAHPGKVAGFTRGVYGADITAREYRQ